MNNVWQWWQDKLGGKDVPMSEGTPHAGFYRWAQRGKYGGPRGFLPVAYWLAENGELNCRIGDQNVTPEKGRDIWIYVGDNPVREEDYRAVAERGELWFDEHPAVPMQGHNLPPEPTTFEELRDAVEDLGREAMTRVQKGDPIKDQAEADQIANLADRLAELNNKIDDARREEKKVHDLAAAAVQKKWTPLLVWAETYKALKYNLLTPWFQSEERRKAEETEAARAEGAEATEPPRSRAGTRGRAMSLRNLKRAEIVDYPACYEFFKENSELQDVIKDMVRKLATRAVRAGITVPGTKVIEEGQVV